MAVAWFAGREGISSGTWFTDLLSRGVVSGLTGRVSADGNRWVQITSQEMWISGDGASRNVSMYTANEDGSGKVSTGTFSVNLSNPATRTGAVGLSKTINANGQNLMVGFNAPSGTIRFGVNTGTNGSFQLMGGGGGVVANYNNTSLAGNWGFIQAPSEPRSLTAVTSGANITATWVAPLTNGDTPITGYRLEYSSNDFATFTTVDLGAAVLSHTFAPGAAPEWRIRVASKNAVTTANSTWSVYSNVAVAAGYTPPDAPTSLAVTTAPLSATVTWVAPSNTGGSPITGYRLQWRVRYGTWANVDLGVVTSHTMSLTQNEYEVRVAARNIAGVGTYTEPNLFTVPEFVPSGAPENFTATALARAVALTWTEPTNLGGSPVNNYRIDYAPTAGGATTTILLGRVFQFTVNNLPSQDYDFTVTAINQAGASVPTAVETVTPLDTPDAPRLFFIEPDVRAINASWQIPANDGDSPVTHYILRYQQVGSGTWTDVNVGLVQNATISLAAESYNFQVYAVNALGNGAVASLGPVAVPLYVSPNPELRFIDGSGSAGELISYQVTQDVTPSNLFDTSGGVTQIQFTARKNSKSRYLANDTIEVWRYGKQLAGGVVDSLTYDTVEVSASAQGLLRLTVVDKTAPPMLELTVDQIFTRYFELCGIPAGSLDLDATLQGFVRTYPGWQGDVWLHLKMLAEIHDMEIVELGNTIYVRPYFSVGTLNNIRVGSVSYSADYNNAALTVEANYNDAQPLYDDVVFPLTEQDFGNIITVSAGEYVEREIDLSVFLESVSQPVARDVDENPPQQLLESEYMIIGSDNLPVSAQYWTDNGGHVEVEILEPSNKVLVKVTAPREESPFSPYKLAISDNETTHQRLFLVGTGVRVEGGLISIPTGASETVTSRDVGVTIDSPFVTNMSLAYIEAVKAARECNGVSLFGTIEKLGNRISSRVLGGRMFVEDNKWRVRGFTETPVTQSLQMDNAFDYDDFVESVGEMTYAEWADSLDELTYDDLKALGYGKDK